MQLIEQDNLHPTIYKVKLAIIDREFNLTFLIKNDQQPDEFIVTKKVNLIKINTIFKEITEQNIEYGSVILSECTIYAPTFKNQNIQGITFHVNTDTYYKSEYKIMYRKEKKELAGVREAFFAHRKVALIYEEDFSYFEVTKSPQTRQLHLFSSKQQRPNLAD